MECICSKFGVHGKGGLWVGLKMKGKACSVWKCEMGYERVAALYCSATCRLEWTEIRMVCWMGGVSLRDRVCV